MTNEADALAERVAHIGAAGRELIDAIIAEMDEDDAEPDAREAALLVQAGELRDRQAALQAAVDDAGEVLVSKTGAVRIHPGVAESRQIAVAIARVLSSVSLAEPTSTKDPAKVRAARARWDRHG